MKRLPARRSGGSREGSVPIVGLSTATPPRPLPREQRLFKPQEDPNSYAAARSASDRRRKGHGKPRGLTHAAKPIKRLAQEKGPGLTRGEAGKRPRPGAHRGENGRARGTACARWVKFSETQTILATRPFRHHRMRAGGTEHCTKEGNVARSGVRVSPGPVIFKVVGPFSESSTTSSLN